MQTKFINPFVLSTINVFSTMLDCELTRGELSLSSRFQPQFDVSGVIGLTGRVSGTVVLSLSRDVALAATGVMLGGMPDTIDGDVVDASGELTNMVAGKAKADLAEYNISLALPTVITGKNHAISFGEIAQTICIPYECKWGSLSVEVGLVEDEQKTNPTSSQAEAAAV